MLGLESIIRNEKGGGMPRMIVDVQPTHVYMYISMCALDFSETIRGLCVDQALEYMTVKQRIKDNETGTDYC